MDEENWQEISEGEKEQLRELLEGLADLHDRIFIGPVSMFNSAVQEIERMIETVIEKIESLTDDESAKNE
jgi:hypothetical protein